MESPYAVEINLTLEINYAQWLQSCLLLCDPMNCSPQAPLSMGSPRQEYWTGLSFPSPGDLPDPGTEPTCPVSPVLQAVCLPLSHWGSPQNNHTSIKYTKK